MRITVLTGGTSAERDVALASGIQVARALRERRHTVSVVDLAAGFVAPEHEDALLPGGVGREPPPRERLQELERGMLGSGLGEIPAVRAADVLFLALHGGRGEDGSLQAVLDVLGVPYTGSGPLASALAMDKDLAKHVLRSHGIVSPPWAMAPVTAAQAKRVTGFPCIVKPSKQGSSVGMSLVRRARDLPAALALAGRYDDEVLVETYVEGPEYTVGILGGRALPVVEIRPLHELFDYECKYTPGMADEIAPAPIGAKLAAALQDTALRAHRALKLGGYSRIDFRADADGAIFFLEANTLPGLTANSLIPKAARAAGMGFPVLCETICRLALEARGTKR